MITNVIPLEPMHRFEIVPNVGVGPVLLGMMREQVRDAIFSCSDLDQSSHPTLDYAFGNSHQIEYDGDGHAQFMGVGYFTGCGCDYEFRGRHIGDYTARELFELLADLDDCKHTYDPNSYFFQKIMMNVWDADEQYDYRGGESTPVYGQVGIANQQYTDSISTK